MDTSLVVMAAGMGSRFGGIKQIAPLGPNGEILLDFSVYDAVRAGFSKVVFVIKKDIEQDFRAAVGKRIEKMVDVDYVFQELTDIPEGFSVPEGRVKPWGTGQAVLTAAEKVNTPFAVINADDYYGEKAYTLINNHLAAGGGSCCVLFQLGNTLSENGTVSRGICSVKDGCLTEVTEHTALDKNSGFPFDTLVSMNMWGFSNDFFGNIGGRFEEFLKNLKNPLKDEFYLPGIVDDMIKKENEKVTALVTDDRWYGVTYKEDSASVREAIQKMISEGKYSEL
ncbi:MAG: NTP transferase domain-containing protein [Clostridia bacterium]|nr:NTP transferase domain-containing protein [Clostridia bacterium]